MPPVEPDVKPSVSDTTPPASATAKAAKPTLAERFKALILDYGPVALALHFLMFGLTVAGFYVAIQLGFQVDSTGGKASALGAAYVAAQLTKPVRWIALFVLTPLVARIPPVARFIERNRHKWGM
jgi:hypothetical protein